MLIVSGTLPSGKTVFEEVIPAQELVKEFKIPSMGKYAEFRIDPKFTKKDAETGEIRLGRSQAFVPYYTIGTDNGSVSIRYADQRIPAAAGQYEYKLTGGGSATNRMVDFVGEAFVFTKPSDIEKFIWYYLHPLNGSNPFRKPNGQYRYWFLDRETEAQKRLELQTAIEAIKTEILEKDETSLRVLAAALSYKKDAIERNIPNQDTISISALRLALLDRLNADGEPFVQAWRTGNNTLFGMIQFAVDKGILKTKGFPGGRFWVWNTAENHDTPIVAVSNVEPEIATLKRTFNDNYQQLVPILNSAINDLRIKEIELPDGNVMSSDEELTLEAIFIKGWDWVVTQSILRGLLMLDYSTKQVRQVVKGVPGLELLEVNDAATWKDELIARMKTPEGAPLRIPLGTALVNSLNGVEAGAQLTALDFIQKPVGKKGKAAEVVAPVEPEPEQDVDVDVDLGDDTEEE